MVHAKDEMKRGLFPEYTLQHTVLYYAVRTYFNKSSTGCPRVRYIHKTCTVRCETNMRFIIPSNMKGSTLM